MHVYYVIFWTACGRWVLTWAGPGSKMTLWISIWMTIIRAPPGWLFIIIRDSYLTARLKRDSSIIMPGTHRGSNRDTDESLHYGVSVYKHQIAELLKWVNHIFRESIVKEKVIKWLDNLLRVRRQRLIVFSPSHISVLLLSVQPCPLTSQESGRRTAWLWWCNCWCYHDRIRDWPCLMIIRETEYLFFRPRLPPAVFMLIQTHLPRRLASNQTCRAICGNSLCL